MEVGRIYTTSHATILILCWNNKKALTHVHSTYDVILNLGRMRPPKISSWEISAENYVNPNSRDPKSRSLHTHLFLLSFFTYSWKILTVDARVWSAHLWLKFNKPRISWHSEQVVGLTSAFTNQSKCGFCSTGTPDSMECDHSAQSATIVRARSYTSYDTRTSAYGDRLVCAAVRK